MKILPLVAGIVAFGLVSAAQAQSPVPAADHAFAQKAAGAGVSEIAEAKIALDKSNNADVKQFAQRMVTDHTKIGDQLTQIAQGKSLNLPTEPIKRDQAQAARLQKLSGAAFDKRYVADQVAAHKKAVALFKRESAHGKDADLKQFATQNLPILQHHLEMAESLAGAK